jgi:hypothetical protein
MRLFARRDGYVDPRVPRRDVYLGALFILAAAVVVAKAADLKFDKIFYGGAAAAVMLLLLTKNKLGYIAAAFLWIGFRLVVFGGWVSGESRLAAWGVFFVAAALVTAVIALRRERRDETTRPW